MLIFSKCLSKHRLSSEVYLDIDFPRTDPNVLMFAMSENFSNETPNFKSYQKFLDKIQNFVLYRSSIFSPEKDMFAVKYRMRCNFNYRNHDKEEKHIKKTYILNSLEEMMLQLMKFRHSEFEPVKFSDKAAAYRLLYSLNDAVGRGIKVNVINTEINVVAEEEKIDNRSRSPSRTSL